MCPSCSVFIYIHTNGAAVECSVLGPLLFITYVSPISNIASSFSSPCSSTPITHSCTFQHPHSTWLPNLTWQNYASDFGATATTLKWDKTKLYLQRQTVRKAHMMHRLLSFSMTLNDPNPDLMGTPLVRSISPKWYKIGVYTVIIHSVIILTWFCYQE